MPDKEKKPFFRKLLDRTKPAEQKAPHKPDLANVKPVPPEEIDRKYLKSLENPDAAKAQDRPYDPNINDAKTSGKKSAPGVAEKAALSKAVNAFDAEKALAMQSLTADLIELVTPDSHLLTLPRGDIDKTDPYCLTKAEARLILIAALRELDSERSPDFADEIKAVNEDHRDGRFRVGTVRPGGYSYRAIVDSNEKDRVIALTLYDFQGTDVIRYRDGKWDMEAAQHYPTEAEAVNQILDFYENTNAMAPERTEQATPAGEAENPMGFSEWSPMSEEERATRIQADREAREAEESRELGDEGREI